MNLNELTKTSQSRLNKIFLHYFQNQQCPNARLQQAMNYSIGGKYIRPLLVYATGLALGASLENCDPAAAAIELIHTYSLIHDDLPSMDNADTRRGKPSCHKAYDEVTAILAGDALQPLAFQIIAEYPAKLSTEQRIAMIQTLSKACGMHGMAAGQMLDMQGVSSLAEITRLYQLKTGCLLSASVSLGILAADQPHSFESNLNKFAENIGLAFQLQDDLLDAETNSGKPLGLDAANNKNTYVKLAGIDKTHEKIQVLFKEALTAIKPLGKNAELLSEIAHSLLQRKS